MTESANQITSCELNWLSLPFDVWCYISSMCDMQTYISLRQTCHLLQQLTIQAKSYPVHARYTASNISDSTLQLIPQVPYVRLVQCIAFITELSIGDIISNDIDIARHEWYDTLLNACKQVQLIHLNNNVFTQLLAVHVLHWPTNTIITQADCASATLWSCTLPGTMTQSFCSLRVLEIQIENHSTSGTIIGQALQRLTQLSELHIQAATKFRVLNVADTGVDWLLIQQSIRNIPLTYFSLYSKTTLPQPTDAIIDWVTALLSVTCPFTNSVRKLGFRYYCHITPPPPLLSLSQLNALNICLVFGYHISQSVTYNNIHHLQCALIIKDSDTIDQLLAPFPNVMSMHLHSSNMSNVHNTTTALLQYIAHYDQAFTSLFHICYIIKNNVIEMTDQQTVQSLFDQINVYRFQRQQPLLHFTIEHFSRHRIPHEQLLQPSTVHLRSIT